ncbi:MAG: caspase family protein [Acidobacteriota bacterium]|nr:caspase family protein [Acidobacteriota bacterium]
MFKRTFIKRLSASDLLAAIALLAVLLYGASNSAQERGQGVRRPNEAKPEQRIALVIGNASYKEAPLSNPINDAQNVAAALQACDFEILGGVNNGLNRNQRQMKDLIRQFGQKLRAGGVGVFYFAGHGVQVGGKNYLIPVGAEINSEAEVEYESVELGFVLAQLEEARNRLT